MEDKTPKKKINKEELEEKAKEVLKARKEKEIELFGEFRRCA